MEFNIEMVSLYDLRYFIVRGKYVCFSLQNMKVLNCEGPEILPYFHANKLACRSFVDSGRRNKTLESEIKDFINHRDSDSLCVSICLCSFPCPRVPKGDLKGVRWQPHTQWKCRAWKMPALCSGERHWFCLSKMVATNILKVQSRTKPVSASPNKAGRNLRGPWRIVSQQLI